MSFDIPPQYEADINRYAKLRHLSVEDAVAQLLQAGLARSTPAEEGLGLFSSPEDVAALDAAVELAYEERRRPSKRIAGL